MKTLKFLMVAALVGAVAGVVPAQAGHCASYSFGPGDNNIVVFSGGVLFLNAGATGCDIDDGSHTTPDTDFFLPGNFASIRYIITDVTDQPTSASVDTTGIKITWCAGGTPSGPYGATGVSGLGACTAVPLVPTDLDCLDDMGTGCDGVNDVSDSGIFVVTRASTVIGGTFTANVTDAQTTTTDSHTYRTVA